jgi:hypothetical protein
MDSDYDTVHITPGRDDRGRLATDPADVRNHATAMTRVIILMPSDCPSESENEDQSEQSDRSDAAHERHDVDFRDDFYLNYRSEPGVTYELYQPAYHYGNELAWDRVHRGAPLTESTSQTE